MEKTVHPSRCFKFADAQIVCWLQAAWCKAGGLDVADNSRFCKETWGRSLGDAMQGAAGFLGRNDIVVANAGIHFNIDGISDRAHLLAELEGVCTNLGIWDEAERPLVVWRESAPQGWATGRFPYDLSMADNNISVFDCEAWPDDWVDVAEPWMSEYNPYNRFFESALAECDGVRRLPVWLPSAMLGSADRVAARGDCTHYFPSGSAYSLWNTMLLDLLRSHDGDVERRRSSESPLPRTRAVRTVMDGSAWPYDPVNNGWAEVR
jgi:hypothetical protein